jgi:hypothetical protein
MPAKNKRPSTKTGIHADLAAHFEANRQAHAWAAKCLVLLEAGNRFEAERAKYKARHWLKKVMALESKVGGPPRTGGRARG